MVCERGSSVFDVDSANLISRVNLIAGVELALIAVLADANGVKKSVVMKTMTIEEINRREMCFMFALFLK
jgi:predicted peroxiredoxin